MAMLPAVRACRGVTRHGARLVARRAAAPPAAAGHSAHFCSGAGGEKKKPPKGFERFYEQAKTGNKEEAKETEGKAEKEGPGENSKQESGKGQKSSSSSSSSSGSSSSDKKGSSSSSSSSSSPSGLPQQLNRQQLGMAAAAAAFLLYMYGNQEEIDDEVTIQEMMREYLMKGYVDKIQIINKSFCRVHLRPDAPGNMANKQLTIQLGTPEAFEAKIEQLQNELGISPLDHVAIQYVNETDMMSELLPHLPSLLILIPLLFAARAMSGGMGGPGGGGGGPGGRNIFSIGKAFPAGQKDLKSKIKFSDVAGLEQPKKEVMEFVDFLKNPAKYESLGARVPKGGLLVGPPGTGKTLLAKAVAGEADCPFYSMSGSDFIEMFVGVGPSRVRDLFAQARATAPSIIFIDEIDAVGRKRGKGGFGGGGNDERENTLNQLLVEMDGFASGTGVVVLAGTNRVDVLDPALIRPGRFDRTISIDKPDLNERQAIFQVHLKPVSLSEKLDTESVAKRMAALTPGFVGADIANICNEAAIFAARRTAVSVDMEDFERATERVMGGLPKTNNLMSKEDRRAVALHESGHAIVGWFLEHADPLLKVSIVPRSNGALGFAQYLPGEMSLFSKEAILDKIAVSLGGRAAEELFVGKISTGAADDLDKVTKMAYSMVSVYGMNPEVGLLSYGQNNSNEQFYKPYSEETGQIIDREARSIVEEQYERVKALLKSKSELMVQLADNLTEKETLVYNDILQVLGERPYGVQAQFRSFVTAGGNPFTADMGDKSVDAAPEGASKDAGTGGKAEAADASLPGAGAGGVPDKTSTSQ